MGVLETEALRSGPLDPADAATLPAPPLVQLSPLPQLLRFNQRQIEFVFGARGTSSPFARPSRCRW